jgi:transcriptional regulator with XRE-family HTH domain
MKAKNNTNARSVTDGDARVGNRIRALRIDRELSQADVAEALGVSFQQIQKYEKGTNRLSVMRAEQISALFQVSVQELLGEGTGKVGKIDMVDRFDTESYKLAREMRFLNDDVKLRMRKLVEAIVAK